MFSKRRVEFDEIKEKKRLRRRKLLKILGALLLLLTLLGGLVFANLDRLSAFFTPISFLARLVNPVQLKETDGRVNGLILGLDSREGTGLLNTDTILVGSFSLTEGEPVLVSIPRDFWVNLSPYGYGRINAAYSRGGTQSNGSFKEEEGITFAKGKVEEILGISLPYYVVIDFKGFEEIIDTLGEIEVCVERAFDDYSYPIPGEEANPVVSHRYEHLHFDAGCQKMDGPTALKYARSRSGTNQEGSDFARVRRQQNVLLAVKDKIFELNLIFDLPEVAHLYQQFSRTVKTNVSLGEIQRALEISDRFADLTEVQSLVLDPDSGLVFHPAAGNYGGAYVLVPVGGNYTKIHAKVQELLFPAEEPEQTAQ